MPKTNHHRSVFYNKTSSAELKMCQGAGSLYLHSSQHTCLPSHHTLWIVWKKCGKDSELKWLSADWFNHDWISFHPTNKLFPAVKSNCKVWNTSETFDYTENAEINRTFKKKQQEYYRSCREHFVYDFNVKIPGKTLCYSPNK